MMVTNTKERTNGNRMSKESSLRELKITVYIVIYKKNEFETGFSSW